MAANQKTGTETSLAVIQEQIKQINQKLDSISKIDTRIEFLEKENARQSVINIILGIIGAASLTGLVGIMLPRIFG